MGRSRYTRWRSTAPVAAVSPPQRQRPVAGGPGLGQSVPCAADRRGLRADAGVAPAGRVDRLRPRPGMDTSGAVLETRCAGDGLDAPGGHSLAAVVPLPGCLPANRHGPGSIAGIERPRSTQNHPLFASGKQQHGKALSEKRRRAMAFDPQSSPTRTGQQNHAVRNASAISYRPKHRADTPSRIMQASPSSPAPGMAYVARATWNGTTTVSVHPSKAACAASHGNHAARERRRVPGHAEIWNLSSLFAQGRCARAARSAQKPPMS